MRKLALMAAVVAGGLATSPAWAGDYIALGDSITFGETNLIYQPSYGDRGYVADFADYLGSRNGGARPNVINLAIDGETTGSFVTNSGRTAPVDGRGDGPLQQENLNYVGDPVSQASLFASTVAQQEAAGQSIDTISVTLGFNNLAALASLPLAQAEAEIPTTLQTFQTQYSGILSDILSLTPDANLYLLGYYNPFPADPSSPAAPIFNTAGMELNGVIESLATEFGAHYVDTAPGFVGKEAQLTYEAAQPAGYLRSGDFGGVEPIGDVHPNADGYGVIASEIEGVSPAPEPATWALMIAGAGLIGTVLRSARRQPRRERASGTASAAL